MNIESAKVAIQNEDPVKAQMAWAHIHGDIHNTDDGFDVSSGGAEVVEAVKNGEFDSIFRSWIRERVELSGLGQDALVNHSSTGLETLSDLAGVDLASIEVDDTLSEYERRSEQGRELMALIKQKKT